MNLQQFIERVFEAEIPSGYEITRIDLSVAAADSADGGKVFFRGGSDAAKITLEKKRQNEVVTPAVVPVNSIPVRKLYHCIVCSKDYGRNLGKSEEVVNTTCKECKNVTQSD